jgi:hypothetical protein
VIELLRRHLLLAVDEPADDPPEVETTTEVDDPVETALDDLLPEAPTRAAPQEPAESPRERELRERAERAEFERDTIRSVQTPRQQPMVARGPQESPEDRAELDWIAAQRAKGANDETIQWYQQQHNTNRTVRETRRMAEQSMRTSQDAADAAAFQSLASDPRYKRYVADVEKHYQANAAAGNPMVPRATILRLVLGDAMLQNKPKPKAAARPQTPGNPDPGRVDRGRRPPARSDVSRDARNNASQALRDRLKDQLI